MKKNIIFRILVISLLFSFSLYSQRNEEVFAIWIIENSTYDVTCFDLDAKQTFLILEPKQQFEFNNKLLENFNVSYILTGIYNDLKNCCKDDNKNNNIDFEKYKNWFPDDIAYFYKKDTPYIFHRKRVTYILVKLKVNKCSCSSTTIKKFNFKGEPFNFSAITEFQKLPLKRKEKKYFRKNKKMIFSLFKEIIQ